MSILIIESFEFAANGLLDLTHGESGRYLSDETNAAFWAWSEARKGLVISLPNPFTSSSNGPESDLFSRQQISEMTNAAGIELK